MEQITSQTIYTVFDADMTSYVILITIQTDHLCQLNDLFVYKCPYVGISLLYLFLNTKVNF